MALPCASIVADTPRLHGSLPQPAADASLIERSDGARRSLYGGRSRRGIASRLPLHTLTLGTLWIKEVGCHSLLPVASIHARFGRAVRALRAKAGYSQESFADAVHIHRTSMGTLERGDGNPMLETIVKIARGLDLSLTELFLAVEKDTP